MVACLRDLPAPDIETASIAISYIANIAITVDGTFLPATPTQLWGEGRIHPGIDYMTGVNSEEATPLIQIVPREDLYRLLEDGIKPSHYLVTAAKYFPQMMTYPGLAPAEKTQLIFDHYFTDLDNPHKTMRHLLDYAAHIGFLGPAINQITNIATTNPSYLYYFARSPDGDVPYSYSWGEFPAVDWGAEHGMEMGYVFGHMSTPGVPGSSYDNVSQADREIGRAVNQAWVTFAKTGQVYVYIYYYHYRKYDAVLFSLFGNTINELCF